MPDRLIEELINTINKLNDRIARLEEIASSNRGKINEVASTVHILTDLHSKRGHECPHNQEK